MGWGLFLHVAAALQPAVASTGCGLGSSLDQPGCIHAPLTVKDRHPSERRFARLGPASIRLAASSAPQSQCRAYRRQ